MFKLSIKKELFHDIFLKKVFLLEKEASSYWKKELLIPQIINDKIEYKLKDIKKIVLSNGLGADKPNLTLECEKLEYLETQKKFIFHLGKIIEQKNINSLKDEKDILIKQLEDEKKELLNILNEIKNSNLLK